MPLIVRHKPIRFDANSFGKHARVWNISDYSTGRLYLF